MQMAKDTCPVIPNADFMTLRLTAKREKGLSGANPESPEGRGFSPPFSAVVRNQG
jgi:hypothetical protein